MQKTEQIFLEGISAGESGLPDSICPYPYLDRSIFTGEETTQIAAPANWRSGWELGKVRSILALRTEKRADVLSGISAIIESESDFLSACISIEKGFLRTGLEYFSAKKSLKNTWAAFGLNPNIKLLYFLRIRPYWQDGRWNFADDLLGDVSHNSEKWFRQLVSRYGEKHGVKLVWSTYIRESDYLSKIIEDVRGEVRSK